MIADAIRQKLEKARGDAFVDVLFEFMREYGESRYDESVTQLDHALQAANLAHRHGAPQHLVTAALLHDLGHFLLDEHASNGNFLEQDLCHESVGAEFLQEFFPEAVYTPIELHVPAKRYLCTTRLDYYDQLSEASKRSFQLQGGGLSSEEKESMESNLYLKEALQLRIWDDQAKNAGEETPALEEYRQEVRESALAQFQI